MRLLAGNILALLIFAVAASHARSEQPAAPPNVVLILSDDQAWTDFGFMGHDTIETPRIDRLASESAVFPNGYVPTSLCRASLASIVTGLYPHQHRITSNDPPDGVDRAKMLPLMEKAPALPRVLASAGYRSLQTGKWWEGRYENGGFTDGMTVSGRHGEQGLAIGRKTMQPIADFLDKFAGPSAGKPFFLWYAPMMPHEPHNPPPRLLKKYQTEGRHERLAKYYAMCQWFDETVGTLLDELDRRKLADNTLVIFCADNGWIQDTTSDKRGGLYAPKSKRSPYDGGLRTPVLIRWPGHVKTGKYDDLVSTIDFAPTVLAAAGIKKPPADLPGMSLLDTAAGKGPLTRDAVFGEVFEHTAIDIDSPSKNLLYRWVRAKNWKLIVPVNESPERPAELYDLVADPHEETNLAAEHPDRVAALRGRLDAWWPGK
ncbi:MAG: sulfatase [Pirellulales bacterium]